MNLKLTLIMYKVVKTVRQFTELTQPKTLTHYTTIMTAAVTD